MAKVRPKMRIDGKHTCIDCLKEFEWMYISEPAAELTIEMIDKPQAIIVDQDKDIYFINIFCPHCRQLNAFQHKVLNDQDAEIIWIQGKAFVLRPATEDDIKRIADNAVEHL